MLTPTDIAEFGERHVEKWLSDNNFQCHRTPSTSSHVHGHPSSQNQSHAVDLEARNADTTMIVHICTAMAPIIPHELTPSEQHGLSSRAMTLGYDAWSARVQIDGEGALLGDIQWIKLV